MLRTVSHYRIEREIGRGGMGVVYDAVDTRLGRRVAIKMLPAEATADSERNRRFVQEARAASALNHPHIVTIHDIGEADGETFIAMELVEGTPLDRLLAEGPLSVAKALEYGAQVAGALEAAHARGIVHRDIKPANIMITRDGRAKVLDFGLAKLAERGPAETTMTGVGTQPGLIIGTASYMSPEQAQGLPTDARSDVFSFGAVLYEMLTGRRAFSGATDVSIITAILRDDPPPARQMRAAVPPDVERTVSHCLAKDPAARFATAGAVREELARAHAALTRPADAGWRRPAVLVPAAVVLLTVAAFGVWQMVQARRVRWVREVAIPEIERLHAGERSLAAMDLALQAERYAPEEIARIRGKWTLFNLVTDPAGAQVEAQNYLDVDGPWRLLGTSPIRDRPMPFGHFRLRIRKPGYQEIEVSSHSRGRPDIKLVPDRGSPEGMVFVPGGSYAIGVAKPVTLPDYWMDRNEVTNQEFKEFVDAGGYRDAKYWKHPFVLEGRIMTFDEAIARFRDTTGRPAPASWEVGAFPQGQAEFAVSGISWFEAAAYAEFAGKSLPTIYHWFRAAAADDIFSDVLLLSNFDGRGVVRAGERRGIGPWGTRDMGGNVKEWCLNEAGEGRRYILGGGWNEPAYRFRESEVRNPWERAPAFGVRLVKNLGPADAAGVPVPLVYGDPKSLVPIPDAEFEIYKRFYAYERRPLNPRVEGVDDESEHWRKEKVSYEAAYGGQRITAYFFMPKRATPPYQTVVLFPNAYARGAVSSEYLDYATFEFIMRSGRALIYPVYAGTFERGGGKPFPGGTRDLYLQWAKDFFRTVDYVATRPEVDMNRLAYFSISMGAYFGPIPIALEPRIKAAVLVAGGLRFNYPTEIQPANFMPRVKVPVLLVHGRDDFQVPAEAQRRVFDLLGTPPEHKRHVQLEGGHVPNDIRAMFREALDWFDKYLGPVK
jgi:dienelactone hydrolase/predicted Ser/Thr protein kinase